MGLPALGIGQQVGGDLQEKHGLDGKLIPFHGQLVSRLDQSYRRECHSAAEQGSIADVLSGVQSGGRPNRPR